MAKILVGKIGASKCDNLQYCWSLQRRPMFCVATKGTSDVIALPRQPGGQRKMETLELEGSCTHSRLQDWYGQKYRYGKIKRALFTCFSSDMMQLNEGTMKTQKVVTTEDVWAGLTLNP